MQERRNIESNNIDYYTIKNLYNKLIQQLTDTLIRQKIDI